MNVVAATPLYPPVSRVGAWLTTHEFLRGLVERGHLVTVAPYMTPRADYVLEGVVVKGDGWDALGRADLVVSHLGDNGAAALEAKRRGIPSVRMAHAGGPIEPGRLEGASLLVCNSEATRESIGWDGPTVVIHPPVWPERYATTPGDRVTMVNLSKEKGVELLHLLVRLLPDVPFLGVRGGYGKQRPVRAPNVETVPMTPDMAFDVYARTRILLVPSLKESWGRVGLEAACSGIPTIASPTPGLRESLGDAATFVDPGDLAGWRHEVERLLDPAEWAQASARALERAGQLTPALDVARFCEAVESVVAVAA